MTVATLYSPTELSYLAHCLDRQFRKLSPVAASSQGKLWRQLHASVCLQRVCLRSSLHDPIGRADTAGETMQEVHHPVGRASVAGGVVEQLQHRSQKPRCKAISNFYDRTRTRRDSQGAPVSARCLGAARRSAMTDRPLRREFPSARLSSSQAPKPNNNNIFDNRFQIPGHVRCSSDTERGPNSGPRVEHLHPLSRVPAVANRLVKSILKPNMYISNRNSTSDCAWSPVYAEAIVDDLFSPGVIRRPSNTTARDSFVEYLSSRSILEGECNTFMCLSPHSFRMKILSRICTPKQVCA